jgi:hypothetical protein
MCDTINCDIIYILSNLLNFQDFINLALVNKSFHDLVKISDPYHHHELLRNQDNFESLIPNYRALEYHVDKVLTVNNCKAVYYAGLCSTAREI